MDLRRAALGLHNQNIPLTEKFIQEAKKNIQNISLDDKSYINKIIQKIDFTSPDNLLMSSQIIQNYCIYFEH